MLTQGKLKELLHYQPDTGKFIWLKGVCEGRQAGTHSKGYVIIKLEQQRYAAHRLAFLYMTGKWPTLHVDHIDRTRDNNTWLNLRDVTRCENMQNVNYPGGVSGIRGVCRTKNGKKWQVQMSVKCVKYNFGQYASLEEAEAVAIQERNKLTGQ